ncbi:hypothetical protein BDZ91DRAFT_799999 [Kalaharituber pfeilii]|nr:hypothetical protein BDZ91DRAFT_799999 [Kalaharituber pfeilii]
MADEQMRIEEVVEEELPRMRPKLSKAEPGMLNVGAPGEETAFPLAERYKKKNVGEKKNIQMMQGQIPEDPEVNPPGLTPRPFQNSYHSPKALPFILVTQGSAQSILTPWASLLPDSTLRQYVKGRFFSLAAPPAFRAVSCADLEFPAPEALTSKDAS